jgi:hypothetical protein
MRIGAPKPQSRLESFAAALDELRGWFDDRLEEAAALMNEVERPDEAAARLHKAKVERMMAVLERSRNLRVQVAEGVETLRELRTRMTTLVPRNPPGYLSTDRESTS